MLLKALFISHRAGKRVQPSSMPAGRYGDGMPDLPCLRLMFAYGCGVGDGAGAGADDVEDEGEDEDEGGSG